jgi:hypothetical protein
MPPGIASSHVSLSCSSTGELSQGDFDKSPSNPAIENPLTASQSAPDDVFMPSGIASNYVSPSCSQTGELNQGDFGKSPSITVIGNVSQSAFDVVPMPSGIVSTHVSPPSNPTRNPSHLTSHMTAQARNPWSLENRTSIKIIWKGQLRMFDVPKHFDPKDPIEGPKLLKTLNGVFRTTIKRSFQMSDLPFKEPIDLAWLQVFSIDGSKEQPEPETKTRYRKEESEDSEELEIREASRALKYKDLDDEPEIENLEKCGVDDSADGLNDSDGHSKGPQIPREIMLTPTRDLGKVWTQVESRFKITRDHFSLVSNSHYLEQSGMWQTPLERVEIRFRG